MKQAAKARTSSRDGRGAATRVRDDGWNTGTYRTQLPFRSGVIGLRDATPDDVGSFLKYWHFSGDQIKRHLRIDLTRLGTPDDARDRFMKMIRVPGTEQPAVVFILTLNDIPFGYTNINLHGPDENYPHFHTYMHTDRAVMRAVVAASPPRHARKPGGGVAAVMIGLGLSAALSKMADVRRLVLQTRTTSEGINRALDLYLSPAETRHFENPDGIASPGEFHVRHVHKSQASELLERARALALGE